MTAQRTLLAALVLAGCRGHVDAAAAASSGPPSASERAAPLTASSASPAPIRDDWYLGTWTGSYQAAAYRIDLSTKIGGLAEWTVDDGKRGTGSGTLSVSPNAEGVATGSAEGPLGPGDLRGAFEGDTLSLRLAPKDGNGAGFSGVIVGHHEGDRIVGTLQAATADGHVARAGTLTLARGAPHDPSR